MQYWDNKGRLHDTEDKGRISLGQSLANQARAGLTNLNSWINETNPNSDAYKQKASIIAGLATLPAGMGTKATQLVTNTLKPYVGRKLAQMTAEGIGGGALGGLVEGALDSGLHNENIIQGALKGSAMGATAGGLGGYGLGKIGQGLARKGVSKSTENAIQYFNDYIDDLADKSGVMNDFRGLRAGVSGQGNVLYDTPITETENFKKYFGNSKVVDEDGQPLVVYHGTDKDFDVFDRSKTRANMDIQGNFFSPWELDAKGYGSNVRPFYLSIQNPAPSSVAYKALNKFQGQNNAGVKAREYLEKLGYDGVNNDNEEFIAFYPEQIKSVNNEGTFDINNPNIYKAILGGLGLNQIYNNNVQDNQVLY